MVGVAAFLIPEILSYQMGKRKIHNYRWWLLLLLVSATTINYLDRQILGLLKPLLEPEFGWSETDFAYIVMAFTGAYALGLVSWGWLIDRIGIKVGYSLSVQCPEQWVECCSQWLLGLFLTNIRQSGISLVAIIFCSSFVPGCTCWPGLSFIFSRVSLPLLLRNRRVLPGKLLTDKSSFYIFRKSNSQAFNIYSGSK